MKKLLISSLLILSPTIYANTIYVGDSIALGFKQHNKGKGSTKIGANPSKVLSYIVRTDLKPYSKIVLSTGLSNDCSDQESVEKQFQTILLKNKKINIDLLSSPYCKNYLFLRRMCSQDTNCKLISFPTSDGIHPKSYKLNF